MFTLVADISDAHFHMPRLRAFMTRMVKRTPATIERREAGPYIYLRHFCVHHLASFSLFPPLLESPHLSQRNIVVDVFSAQVWFAPTASFFYRRREEECLVRQKHILTL